MARYVIGGDVGSSGYKTVLLDIETGEIKAAANVVYEVRWVKPNWAQQDPGLWKQAFTKATKELLESSEIASREIEGIAFSGQQHGAVVVDKDNQPLYEAILWCCQRSEQECKDIEETLARETGRKDAYVKEIGMHAVPGFQGPKVLWIYRHLPHIYKRTEKLLFPKDWLKTEISREKRWATELSDLSGSGYLRGDGTLSELVMEIMKLNSRWIPQILPSTSEVGTVSEKIAKEVGLNKATRIPVACWVTMPLFWRVWVPQGLFPPGLNSPLWMELYTLLLFPMIDLIIPLGRGSLYTVLSMLPVP